ncbi:hypothetical protein PN465_02205 [Nodularia spumigena CS-584]|jgi:hypothetical protein|uniref:Uncharacterized protein n=2 Tax=Nodularia spumigena TaxID=70799 RepID=A0A2S0Q6H4_NODSP|nr:hypothetical protein [Nodularia spumigena]AHJ26668.1 hypothetical protein NSP_3140 [Nodularia spumigena CCY9414]AVZ29942.1 hypothetical protein BMF81_00979 [Nodularia spumigena UHCC 0039]MDB9381055.1 hypothetical protein [Nodularia spumigena CS-584]MEA5526218.1 hypothetical protein [Nodularia spumigena UHCC 0143]MEA5559389.1 hypothetical protein [Nodularia spumigena CH309]
MQIKRWESPRRQGRNDKGRGGSARTRQLKKQRQMLRQRLKEANKPNNNKNYGQGEEFFLPPFFVPDVHRSRPRASFQPQKADANQH